MTRKIRYCACAITVLIAIADAGDGMAAGFYIQEQNAAGLGRAQAGNVAVADDASTLYFNPAGLTELDGIQLAGGIDIIIPDAKLVDQGSVNRSTGAFLASPASGGFSAPGGSNGGNPGSATPIPDFYLSAPIPDTSLTVGIGMTAPFGFATKYMPDSFGRYNSMDTFLETIDIAPTIAWKINDTLSVGVGLDEQYAYVKLRSALPNPLVPGGPTPASDGRQTLTSHTWSTGFNIGILVKPADGTKIGLSYRYGITHEFDHGSATISGLSGPLAFANGQTLATADLNLPDIIDAGISQRITPELTLMGDVSYYTWSNFKAIDIKFPNGSPDNITPENYRDTWSIAVGAEYQLTDRLKLRGGIKYDETPTVDAVRNTTVPDGDRYWLAAGLHFKVTEQAGFDAGYAHIFVVNEPVNSTRSFYATAPFPIPTTSTVKAQSQISLDLLSVGFTYGF